MATGVLIMGVGKGTKRLQEFLGCTKTYETTIIFGAATDTYDVLGKVIRRAGYRHITRDKVEKALDKFKGKIMQRPPIYSALRVQGKRLYEYAREGKEVPKEIEARPVEVKELEVMEWMEGESHTFRLPKEDAEDEAKDLAENVLHLGEAAANPVDVPKDLPSICAIASMDLKRKRPLGDSDSEVPRKKLEPGHDKELLRPISEGLQSSDCRPEDSPVDVHLQQGQPTLVEGPPAVKLRMTVTSGFYVRSLSHDLGETLGSLACMCALVRTRQGNYELGKNVLEYEDMEKGEDVWGPKVERLLAEWQSIDAGIDGVPGRVDDDRRRRKSSGDA